MSDDTVERLARELRLLPSGSIIDWGEGTSGDEPLLTGDLHLGAGVGAVAGVALGVEHLSDGAGRGLGAAGGWWCWRTR